MKKNKIIAIIGAILSCMSISSIGVSAESLVTTAPISNEFIIVGEAQEDTNSADILASGECGENATWTLDSNMKLTISGTGTMYDFKGGTSIAIRPGEVDTRADLPWGSYIGNIKNIVIEEGITYIGMNSFYNCCRVDTIILPNTVTSIGSSAFGGYNISYFKRYPVIVIPPSVTSINDNFIYEGNYLICGAVDTYAETISILKNKKFLEVPFDENNNLAISIDELNSMLVENNYIFTSFTTTEATTTATTTTSITTYIPNYPVVTYDQYDCNRDGVVNILDLIYLKKRLFGLI